MNKRNFLTILALIIFAISFRSLLTSQNLSLGDAPYFYQAGMKELLEEPSAWTYRGTTAGGINNLLWLSPIMFIYGVLGNLFNYNNNLVLLALFYIPSIISAYFTSYWLARRYKISQEGAFLSGLLYSLNTYFLLLIDGGQVGIILAYGLFPLLVGLLINTLKNPKHKYLATTSILMFLYDMIDPRFALIAFLTGGLLFFVGATSQAKQNLQYLLLLVIVYVLLSCYWLWPLFTADGDLAGSIDKLHLVSALHPLFLFQPHWPGNIFGQVQQPLFWFIGLPIIIIGGALYKTKRIDAKLLFLFFLFAFFTKGSTYPLGNMYSFFVSSVPFGSAFRDSTKFFTPLFLVSALLLGRFIEKTKNVIIFSLISVYCLALVYPVISGKMNFVLGNIGLSNEYQTIASELSKESEYARVAWIPEKHPLSFETSTLHALDGRSLVNLRPLASINAGSFDAFNYLHNPQYSRWFDILGIKYLVLSGDPRTESLSNEEQDLWNDLVSRVATQSVLKEQKWGTLPVYKTNSTKPHIYAVDKVVGVVGGDDIYDQVDRVDKQGFLFFEDGKFDPSSLEGIASQSATLVFNGKGKDDLAMSFLQEWFLDLPGKNNKWSVFSSQDFLSWKYQLLIRGIDTHDFDYGKGIALSSNAGETIEYTINAPVAGDYYLGVRFMGKPTSTLSLVFASINKKISASRINQFEWFIEPVTLTRGNYTIKITNEGDIKALNTIALIPKVDYEKAASIANTYVLHFGVTELAKLDTLESSWIEVDSQKVGTNRYRITAPTNSYWIILADSYQPKWNMRRNFSYFESVPMYSMINGFYIEPNWGGTQIVFMGQEDFRMGVYISLITIGVVSMFLVWQLIKE